MNNEYWWVQLRPQGLYYARRVDGDDVPLQEGECPGWESLPAAAGARLALSVPGVKVRTHPVSIPTRNRRRFLTALPFALEEQLFRAPESYHFVPLAKPANRAWTPVAVVEHEQMAAWTDAVSARGWHLELLTPDYLLLPEPEAGTWILDAVETPLLLRFPWPAGGAALNEDIGPQPPGALLLALEQAQQQPQNLEVRVTGQDQYEQVGNWQSHLAERGVELRRVQVELSRPAWLARRPVTAAGNLLTGSYRSGRDRLLPAHRLLPAAALAAALVMVLCAHWFLEYSRIQTEHERLNRAIEDTYREAFPEARNLVNPRHQMEQRLHSRSAPDAGGQDRRADLLEWLEHLAPYLGNSTDTRLKAFNFDGRQLTLELSLPDFETLEVLQEQLAGFLELRVEHAEFREGRVNSRLHLERRT